MLDRKELINSLQLAMTTVNVIPYVDNTVSFTSNDRIINISTATEICKCIFNVPNYDKTTHIGFNATFDNPSNSNIKFWIRINNEDHTNIFNFNYTTASFIDFIILPVGKYTISIKATTSGEVMISPYKAKLAVYL